MGTSKQKPKENGPGTGRGGWRPGGGRPKGSQNKRTLRIALEAATAGITPIEVMLSTMRQYVLSGDIEKAAQWASRAAPYCHSRMAAVAVVTPERQGEGSVEFSSLNADELRNGIMVRLGLTAAIAAAEEAIEHDPDETKEGE